MATRSRDNPPWGAFPLSRRQAMLLKLYRFAPFGRGRLRQATLRSLQAGQHAAYDIEVAGIRTRCHLGDNASETKLLLNGKRKDRTQLRQILSHLPIGGTFVDVGANFGLYTLRAAKAVGLDGRVLAIEPNGEMARRLRFNISSNGLNNIVVEDAAVGALSGTATLTFDPERHGSGTLAEGGSGSTQSVKTLPLADICAQHGIRRIDALKIDIEGYEDRALLPLLSAEHQPLWPRMILIEVSWSSRWNDDCIAKLVEAGYRRIWDGRDDVALALDLAA